MGARLIQRDFALGRPGPAEVAAPEPSLLGPDPEPVGCRFEALVRPLKPRPPRRRDARRG
jgi:hypothetical protein